MEKNIVLPNYDHCILNTVTSILKYYKVDNGHTTLNSLDKLLDKKYKNVVLLILDGMGEHILNTLDKDVYGYAFFHPFEDYEKWTYDFDYSTEWIKIPAGKSIELKFNKDNHTGWYGGVLFGINNWVGQGIVKVEDIKESLTTTITGFNEYGVPIIE